MRKISILRAIVVICSCKKEQKVGHEAVLQKSTSYVDVPFAQEYHGVFLISGNNTDANKVGAIHPSLEGSIWITIKNGIYQKS